MNFLPYKTIAEFLFNVEIGLGNGRSTPSTAAALATVGFDAAKMDEGDALLRVAQDLHMRQPAAYGKQIAATEQMRDAWKAADKTVAVHRKLAKLALRDDAQARVELLLNERRKTALDGWLAQTELFYANALDSDEIMAALGRYRVTEAALVGGQTAVSHIAHLRAVQQQRKAAARRATKQRNDALKALRDWHRDFRAVAKIALEGDQMLESLGLKIVVK